MQVKIVQPAPAGALFAPESAATQVGKSFPVRGPSPASPGAEVTGTVVGATVVQDGAAVELTIDVGDAVLPGVQWAGGRNYYSAMDVQPVPREATAMATDLDNTSNCSVADVCEGCPATTDLTVCTFTVPRMGVMCATLCPACIAAEGTTLPRMGYPTASRRILTHCEHLGIDLDSLADLMTAQDDS